MEGWKDGRFEEEYFGNPQDAKGESRKFTDLQETLEKPEKNTYGLHSLHVSNFDISICAHLLQSALNNQGGGVCRNWNVGSDSGLVATLKPWRLQLAWPNFCTLTRQRVLAASRQVRPTFVQVRRIFRR